MMDTDDKTQNENIRKIEDLIDIQKANGSFNCRQVAFNLPSDTDGIVSTNIAKSLESGLSKTKSTKGNKKKIRKLRPSRQKGSLPDVVSWPSDSDITVLRMKLCLTAANSKQRVDSLIPGDGLHQRDSSSMINLATLILQSQPPSKHSFKHEEYLIPISSWERERDPNSQDKRPNVKVEKKQAIDFASKCKNTDDYDYNGYDAVCSYEYRNYSSKDSNSDYSTLGTVSKFARFLRLYFCPCCTCLYKLEKMSDDPTYFKKRRIN